MASVILCWLYVTALGSLCGWLLLHRADRSSEAVPPAVVPMVGLAAVTAAAGYLSLFIGLGLVANLLVWLVALALLWRRRAAVGPAVGRAREQAAKTDFWFWPAAGVLAVVLAFTSIGKPWLGQGFFNYDTGLYHAPSIRWIESHGAVPGLGNLLPPLAVDSQWFVASALFSFAWLYKHPLHALLGFAAFWGFCFALGGVRELLTGKQDTRISSVFRALSLVPLLELVGNIASPTTDEPAAILTLVVLALVCRTLEAQGANRDTRTLQLAVATLALFTVAIKWSVLPLLLPVGYLAWRQWQKEGAPALLGYALLAVGLFTPKLVRSVILSGYLVYPFAAVDWFGFDWKMPLGVVQAEKRSIEGWARMQFRDPAEVMAGGIGFWFPSWFEQFRTTPIAWCLFAAAGVFALSAVLLRGRFVTILRHYGIVYLTAVAGVAYWFWAAPFLRFGYGFLAALAMVLVLPAADALAARLPRLSFRLRPQAVATAALAALVLLTEGEKRLLGTGLTWTKHYLETVEQIYTGYLPIGLLYHQVGYPKIETLLLPMRNAWIYRPLTGQLCWHAPLPCTPYLYGRIELRDGSLQGGFRARPEDQTTPLGDFDGRRLEREQQKQP
ncbi:LIC_10190 family membrane protein [Gloeobacter violaceus]|uniref:Gll3332 protein n=1 Tax=Gloeobacter violaceus (strain ATCC 29082 / PCC 7421) TaxID=251221 RepID=Q7NG41_GLOVI|nr:hypothetical protein [Gloeobacter violaceus]BAC91273.1 gll3332 [Gloeobacter violaceus PCC 7421]